jgi:hypothetical protein
VVPTVAASASLVSASVPLMALALYQGSSLAPSMGWCVDSDDKELACHCRCAAIAVTPVAVLAPWAFIRHNHPTLEREVASCSVPYLVGIEEPVMYRMSAMVVKTQT